MSLDPRVGASRIRARIWMVSAQGAPLEQVMRDEVFCAYEVIDAADRADRERGIHRVSINDATVERVARAISGTACICPKMRPQDKFRQMLPECPACGTDDTKARAMLAALTEEEPTSG